jgi:large subunit ribosomal protein L25
MDIGHARRLVAILPPKLIKFFIRYQPRNPSVPTIYSKQDTSLQIARRLHDFQPIPSSLHTPVRETALNRFGKLRSRVFLPFQNPFSASRNARTGKYHPAKLSLRRQADIIKLAMRFGVEKLLPPSAKQRKLTSGKSKPMRGTMRPKGSRESRNRAEYVENKQKALEESLRVVAMRKTVSHLLNWVAADGVFSGGRSGKTGCRNRVHHGMYLNDISDRFYRRIHLHKFLPLAYYNFAF